MKTLNIDECAHFLKVDKSTALKLASTGGLPGARIGRAWVFLLDDLTDYLRNEIRLQRAERQARAAVKPDLQVVATMPSMMPPRPRGRQRTPRPDLSAYDQLLETAEERKKR
jgi:excisionase family DNA binding protein